MACWTRSGLIALAATGLLGGCADYESDWAKRPYAVLEGELADAPGDEATVMIATIIGGVRHPYCSGVLVAPNVVLTAAHCLGNEAGFDFDYQWQHEAIKVVEGLSGLSDEAVVHDAELVVRHPGYDHELGRYADLALLWIKDNAVASPLPWLRFADSALLDQAQNYTVVGYGNDAEQNSDVRLKTDMPLIRRCLITEKQACMLEYGNQENTSVPSGSLLFNIEKGGPCFGDSGAPVFVQREEQRWIAGVVSGGDTACAYYTIGTDVSAFGAWISDEIERAGQAGRAHDDCCAQTRRAPHSGAASLVLACILGWALCRRRRGAKKM